VKSYALRVVAPAVGCGSGGGSLAMRTATSGGRRVFIYLDHLPRSTGSGSHLRFYSNVQAYVDLGFAVEVVEVSTQASGNILPGDLASVAVRHVPVLTDDPGMSGRLAYRLALPSAAAFRYYFPKYSAVHSAARSRSTRYPDALHHFEGESTGSVLPFLSLGRAIWSLNDLPSAVVRSGTNISCSLENRSPKPSERREARFLARAERWIAKCAPLILCISEADCKHIRAEWRRERVETLPMSVPLAESYNDGDRRPRTDGTLTLLHLGRTAHLPSFRSLEFLLEQVLPSLADRFRQRLRFLVVGSCDGQDARSQRVRQLAARFPREISLLRYVEDLRAVFRESDLQVVASTEATGLRTRIIESFAAGLPVLSTTAAAMGIAGLRPGQNIILADGPEAFGAALVSASAQPEYLRSVARCARRTYDDYFSRRVVAERLGVLLGWYLPDL